MGKRDAYSLFARVYDAWQASYPRAFADAILPFYASEILRRGVPERSLLDLACGTGTFLAGWERSRPGWRLIGVDVSAAMLRVARGKLRAAGLRDARLLRQPMEALAIPRKVGAVVCVFDSVNHLTRAEQIERTFRGVARALLPGGLFVFDVNDERAFPRLFTGTWNVESPCLFVSESSAYDATWRIGTMRFTIFERRGRNWRRTDSTIRERNWGRGEIEGALRDAGFLVPRARRIQPYPPEDVEAPRTLWVARRRP